MSDDGTKCRVMLISLASSVHGLVINFKLQSLKRERLPNCSCIIRLDNTFKKTRKAKVCLYVIDVKLSSIFCILDECLYVKVHSSS
jgi:hypothetical protein